MTEEVNSPNALITENHLWLVQIKYPPRWWTEEHAKTRYDARRQGAAHMDERIQNVEAYVAEFRICPRCGKRVLYKKRAIHDAICWECHEAQWDNWEAYGLSFD